MNVFYIISTVNTEASLSDGEAKFTQGTEGALNTLVATEGTNITITCTAEFLPVNPTVKWLRSSFGEEDFTELTEGGVDDVKLSQDLEEKEWSVTLSGVSEEDAGIYTCETYDESGKANVGKNTVYVTVFTGAANYGMNIKSLGPHTNFGILVLGLSANNLRV